MAELEVKGKKGAPRVDLTPMVDLGFLLITFFMFTTTMAKPKAMQLQMPFKDSALKDEDKSKIKKDQALTILLGQKDRVYYYEGIGDNPNEAPKVEVTYFKDKDGIRDVIIAKKKKIRELQAQGVLYAGDDLTVLIKADDNATTDNVINILDEMTINAVPVYALVDMTPVDQEFINKTDAANPTSK